MSKVYLINKLLKREKGNSAIEFALILPVLLLILFAIFEYSWVCVMQTTLNNAVNQGAVAATKARVNIGEDPEIFARKFVKESFWMGEITDEDIQCILYESDGNYPRRVEVSVSDLPYRPLTAILPESCLPEKLGAKSVVPMQ